MKIQFLLILFLPLFLFGNYSNKVSIVLNENSDDIKIFAAQELKKHLELILKEDILISSKNNQNSEYTFFIGIIPIEINNNTLNDSNYIIKEKKIYLFGNDKILKKENNSINTVLNMKNKVGTLFSVYDFLYNEVGIRWLKPGDSGIIYKNLKELNFNDKSFSWNSEYNFRILRNDIWDYDKFINKLQMNKYIPEELRFSKYEVDNIEKEELLWKRRMKLDTSSKPSYGHAFTKYWEKYGKTNLEWFAMAENGKRGIEGFPKLEESIQKFCVSNIFLQNQIVNNWKIDYEKNGNNIYNASINDMNGYCTCDSCKLLDSKDHLHDEFQEKSKTDRYVYFWNSLLKKAKEFNPNAKLIAYAYSEYRYPPQNIKLSDDIILGFVPNFSDLPNEISKDLKEWKKKGLKEVFLRPNDFNDDIGLPMGHEKFIYEKFKVFKDTSIIGLDYDNAYSFNDWNFEGISRYILLQSFNNSNKSFEELEEEYFQIFGTSKDDIKKYFNYWRNNFELKRLPQIKKSSGLEGRINLYRNISNFYSEEDFIYTKIILDDALKKASSEKIKELIEQIIISNNHAKLIFETYNSNINYEDYYKKLVNYRIEHKDKLFICWPQVFNIEEKLAENYYLRKIYQKIKNHF